jgi:hypothetical protein
MSSPREAADSFLLRSANPDAYKPKETRERAEKYRGSLRQFVVAAEPETKVTNRPPPGS